MRRKRMLLIIGISLSVSVLTVALIVLILCNQNDKPTALSTSRATELYNQAAENIPTDCITYRINRSRKLQGESGDITENCSQEITFQCIGSDDFTGSVSETFSIGTQSTLSSEYFQDGIGYFIANDNCYSSQMTADEFISQYAKPLLLDSARYDSITGTSSSKGYALSFTDPNAPEQWISGTEISLIHAEGTMLISNSNMLQQCTITCQYQLGNWIVTEEATAVILDTQDPVLPATFAEAITVTHPDTPKLLDRMCGYLTTSVAISAEYTESISCQAFGDKRKQLISIQATAGNNLTANVNTQITLSNDSKSSLSTLDKQEQFQDGVYSMSINNSTPTQDSQIDQTDMMSYYQDILISTILLPDHINDMRITEENGILTILFAANETFAMQIRSDALNALYQDSSILNTQTQSYTTESAEFYIQLDRNTGLPVGSGFSYIGVYTTDDLPYRLVYQADQTYCIQ